DSQPSAKSRGRRVPGRGALRCERGARTRRPSTRPPSRPAPRAGARLAGSLIEVDGDRQRLAAPPVEIARVPRRVLLEQEPAGDLVLARIVDDARAPGGCLVPDAHAHARLLQEVLHPVGAVATAGEHVENRRLWARASRDALRRHCEPDLDLPRLATNTSDGGQV